MVYDLRRTQSLPSDQVCSTLQEEVLLFVLPSTDKVEIVTSKADQASSNFPCCFDSCDMKSISSAFRIFLGFDDSDEEEDTANGTITIRTSLNHEMTQPLSSDELIQNQVPPPLKSASTSSISSDDLNFKKSSSLSRSFSGILQRLSLNLSKSSSRLRKDEAKTADCSRSEDEEIEEHTNQLPLSYMDNLPSFSYTMEDEGEHGVGITPKVNAQTIRYRLAALDAATNKDFCALHELFFQCLLDEAKARRAGTESISHHSSSSNDAVIDASGSFDDSILTNTETSTSPPDDHPVPSLESVQNLEKPYPLSYESPSYPLPCTSNRNFFKLYSARSLRLSSSQRTPWYRFRRSDLARREDLIIAPTSDFSTEDEKNKQDPDHSPVERKLMRIAPIFVHEKCRLQKDKYKGVKLGSIISAYGRDAVLRKINEKINLIAAIDLEDSRAVVTRADACRMPLALTRTLELNEDCKNDQWDIDPDEAFHWENKDVVETRSMIGIRMGMLSVQYGLLIHWDVSSCTADLVVLRKMCSDDFINKKVRTLKSVSAKGVPIHQKDVQEPQAIVEDPVSSSSSATDQANKSDLELSEKSPPMDLSNNHSASNCNTNITP